MAQYQSSLTGPEIDAALTDMAQHDSEAWAVGTRDGAAVTSLDVTYHNNAAYYANEASGAAARAEAAVPAGTAGAVFFDQAQTLTTAQQEQARSNINAGVPVNFRDFKASATASSSVNYRVFARCPKNSTGVTASSVFLVSGVTGLTTNAGLGVYIVQVYNRNSTFALRYTKIAPDSGTPSFGYYDGGDGYYYIGVYRGTYGASPEIIELTSPSATYAWEFDIYYDNSTSPSGWTAGTAATV